MFDWKRFLRNNRIEFEQEGKHNIKVHCPFCADDPSMHMIISTENKGWKCWRNVRQHRGRDPTKLVAALLRCSFQEAKRITGSETPDTTDFFSQVHSLLDKPKYSEPPVLELPPEFRSFSNKPSCKPYLRYLEKRGHNLDDAEDFGLIYATTGRFGGRIIFPMYLRDNLIGWTGRAIGSREPRYLTEGAINHSLLWFDDLKEHPSDILIICEGPFDALKINTLGRPLISATCFGTTMPSPEQVNLLYEIAPLFDKVLLLLDEGTTSIAMHVLAQFRSIGMIYAKLPEGVKDPGEMNRKQMALTIKRALDKREP